MQRGCRSGLSSELIESLAPWISDGLSQILLDAQQLVVLGDAVRPGQRPGLDLERIHPDRDVRDGRVLGLAGAVGDHRGISRSLGHLDRRESLGEGADLIHLDQDRVGYAQLYAFAGSWCW